MMQESNYEWQDQVALGNFAVILGGLRCGKTTFLCRKAVRLACNGLNGMHILYVVPSKCQAEIVVQKLKELMDNQCEDEDAEVLVEHITGACSSTNIKVISNSVYFHGLIKVVLKIPEDLSDLYQEYNSKSSSHLVPPCIIFDDPGENELDDCLKALCKLSRKEEIPKVIIATSQKSNTLGYIAAVADSFECIWTDIPEDWIDQNDCYKASFRPEMKKDEFAHLLIPLADYATKIGVSYRTAWNKCKAGDLPCVRDSKGSIFVIDTEDQRIRKLVREEVIKTMKMLKEYPMLLD